MTKSPYRRGADDGFKFGFYLAAIILAAILSHQFHALSMVSLVLAAGVPVVVYRLMLRYERELGAEASFSAMWMHGVMTFGCGSLVAGAILAVYLTWVEPDFIFTQISNLADMPADMQGIVGPQVSEVAKQMIELRFIPTAMDLIKEMMMLAVVTGSMLCASISAERSLRRRRSTPSLPSQQ